MDGGLLSSEVTYAQRTMLLGLLLTSYSIAQFFAAPILGALSDRLGRKKIIILSYIGNCLGYLFCGIGVSLQKVNLLFLGHIVAGLTGANIAVTNSAIADISTHQEKAKNFGLVTMALGIAFIVGPYTGGVILSFFSNVKTIYHPVFFVAAGMAAFNILLVILSFQETLERKRATPLGFLIGIRNIKKAVLSPKLRRLYLIIFLFAFGWTFYSKLSPVYLIEKFQFNQKELGLFFAYFGLWAVLAQGIVLRLVAKHFDCIQILHISSLLLAITLVLLLIPNQTWGIYLLVPFIAIAQGLMQSNSTAIISNTVSKEIQGQTLGIVQSVQSLSKSMAPFFAGIVVALDPRLPIFCGSIAILIGWGLFHKYRKHIRSVV
ncbi:MAG: Major facilitator superfamily protein 10 Tetracycline transporter-like protein [Chlamydiales bacterium]|nr:Major facilitator superfamily protein 10 Tetracycline transporter-like protein [Chlamydiales bacterium]